jgi:hypothetical protein
MDEYAISEMIDFVSTPAEEIKGGPSDTDLIVGVANYSATAVPRSSVCLPTQDLPAEIFAPPKQTRGVPKAPHRCEANLRRIFQLEPGAEILVDPRTYL